MIKLKYRAESDIHGVIGDGHDLEDAKHIAKSAFKDGENGMISIYKETYDGDDIVEVFHYP